MIRQYCALNLKLTRGPSIGLKTKSHTAVNGCRNGFSVVSDRTGPLPPPPPTSAICGVPLGVCCGAGSSSLCGFVVGTSVVASGDETVVSSKYGTPNAIGEETRETWGTNGGGDRLERATAEKDYSTGTRNGSDARGTVTTARVTTGPDTGFSAVTARSSTTVTENITTTTIAIVVRHNERTVPQQSYNIIYGVFVIMTTVIT